MPAMISRTRLLLTVSAAFACSIALLWGQTTDDSGKGTPAPQSQLQSEDWRGQAQAYIDFGSLVAAEEPVTDKRLQQPPRIDYAQALRITAADEAAMRTIFIAAHARLISLNIAFNRAHTDAHGLLQLQGPGSFEERNARAHRDAALLEHQKDAISEHAIEELKQQLSAGSFSKVDRYVRRTFGPGGMGYTPTQQP